MNICQCVSCVQSEFSVCSQLIKNNVSTFQSIVSKCFYATKRSFCGNMWKWMKRLLHSGVKSTVSWVDRSRLKLSKATKEANIIRQGFGLHILGGCPRGVMVKAIDCGIVVREFVLQSHYYVHFRANTLGKGMNLLILPAMG